MLVTENIYARKKTIVGHWLILRWEAGRAFHDTQIALAKYIASSSDHILTMLDNSLFLIEIPHAERQYDELHGLFKKYFKWEKTAWAFVHND